MKQVEINVNANSRLGKLLHKLNLEIPNYAMYVKRDFWWWRVIQWLMFFNKGFLSKYTTTTKRTVYFSDNHYSVIKNKHPGWDDVIWKLLSHEREHLIAFEDLGTFVMIIWYGLIFFPVGLAYGRMREERKGYLTSLRCTYEIHPDYATSDDYINWLVKQFTSSAYGWMWPFPKTVRKWFTVEIERIKS